MASSGRAQMYNRRIPNSIGMNNAAISGTQRMAAPRILRITIPHAPLVRWRSMRIAIDPKVTPSHAMKPSK